MLLRAPLTITACSMDVPSPPVNVISAAGLELVPSESAALLAALSIGGAASGGDALPYVELQATSTQAMRAEWADTRTRFIGI